MASTITDRTYQKYELYHYTIGDIHDPSTTETTPLYNIEKRHYSLDLSQWRLSTEIANPSPSSYYGVYESFSNWHVDNGIAYLTITVKGGSGTFDIYVASYGEANYDYIYCGHLDTTPVRDNSSTIKATTVSYNTGGSSLSNYLKVSYEIPDSEEHTITIMYWKDRSNHGSGTDRGYLLIPTDSEYKPS